MSFIQDTPCFDDFDTQEQCDETADFARYEAQLDMQDERIDVMPLSAYAMPQQPLDDCGDVPW